MKFLSLFILAVLCLSAPAETLSPLKNNTAPQTFDELWAGFDPRAEPLDTEILKEWEQDGVVLKVLRYRIGVFKGKKAMMAAVYGYPKGAKKLPGLVQIHGGGQYADYRAVLTNAKRGYTTISISWAGRISAPDYNVNPATVKLFWDGKKHDPNYKVTTDWGALDGYHAPGRNPRNNFNGIPTASWTLDAMPSPRNNGWFLCTVGARRALTFLEQQPQVNADRLGVYGHSMGGKLTVLTTGSDSRVKAAAPSCGGISDLKNGSPLYQAALCDNNYLKRIKCPIIFLSPSNDFHGRINDLESAVTDIKCKDWRVTCSPHHNHQDSSEYEVATQLWFDQHLKNSYNLPATPEGKLILKPGKNPLFTVRPDTSQKILAVDIYYSTQGQIDGLKDNMHNTKSRFWHHAKATLKDGIWQAEVPILNTDKPLWIYANILYPLEKPVTGAGYYYGIYTANTFNLSSLMTMVSPGELKAAGVKASLKKKLMIEEFGQDWGKGWYNYSPQQWACSTHKIYDPCWTAPEGAKLALEVQAEKANKLIIRLDDYVAEIPLQGDMKWQKIILASADFKDISGNSLKGWKGLMNLRLGYHETLHNRKKSLKKVYGALWQGKNPIFRNLQWVK